VNRDRKTREKKQKDKESKKKEKISFQNKLKPSRFKEITEMA